MGSLLILTLELLNGGPKKGETMVDYIKHGICSVDYHTFERLHLTSLRMCLDSPRMSLIKVEKRHGDITVIQTMMSQGCQMCCVLDAVDEFNNDM